MLTDVECLSLCCRLGLSADAQTLVQQIRTAPPSRRVQNHAGNVKVRYPSRKMGVTIQAESHRNELAGIYEMEHDPRTLEYYDQPPPLALRYEARNGRRVKVRHTPDYFVIREDEIGWEEWKPANVLVGLTTKMPHRYAQDERGGWRCPPGEVYAQAFGFFYRVRSSAEINWVLQRNWLFLEDYLRPDTPPVRPTSVALARLLTETRPGIRLAELFTLLEGVTRDEVYTLIATEQIYVNLTLTPLMEPERVLLYRDAEIAGVETQRLLLDLQPSEGGGSVAEKASWTVLQRDTTTTLLLSPGGIRLELPTATLDLLASQGKTLLLGEQVLPTLSQPALDRLLEASPAAFREANHRYACLQAAASREPLAIPARTLRRWRARWVEAEACYGCGYLGLLPQQHQRGNRTPRLTEQVQHLLYQCITEDYETLKQRPILEVYGHFLRLCQEAGIPAPSYKTFTSIVHSRPQQAQIQKRQGRRAAYAKAPFYWELSLTTPRHGDRPFEICHIDHTLLDIELVCSQTGRGLGRPWSTFLIDAFSRRVLALFLSFERPSYRACMIILRESVRRYERLPQILVVDGDTVFEGLYFETLLARYECTKKTRPPSEPRFGSVCERLFGTTNTQLIYNLAGNTQLTKNVRQVTKAVNPKRQACWTLADLYQAMCQWAYEVYDTRLHPSLGQTPRDAFAAGLEQGGHRSHRRIPYDETFRLLSLPTTRKGTATLQTTQGLKVHHIYYWSDAFLDSTLDKQAIPIRFDPYDVGVIYAFVKGRWVQCISQYYPQFAGRTEREILLATTELRRQHQQHATSQQFNLSVQHLAEFLASLEAEELLLEQRLRDGELRKILTRLEVSSTQLHSPGAAAPVADQPPAASPSPEPSPQPPDALKTPPPLTMYEDY